MKVDIIGIGPGNQDYLLPLAKRKIQNADCLVGAKRHLKIFRGLGKEEFVIDCHLSKAVSYIKKYRARKKICVLVSGDPGIYSFLAKFSQVFPAKDYTVVPGISAVQMAFAKIGQSWADAKIISLHGRKISNLAAQVKDHPKVFLFTDSLFGPHKIARYLLDNGVTDRKVTVLENLSYPDERIVRTDLKRLSKIRNWGLCVMIIEEALKKTKGKLYGIGIGPGDPSLLTLKASRILEKVDTIFVPRSSLDSSSWARSIVEAVVDQDKNFQELTFPMTTDKAILNKYWLSAAAKIAQEIKKGRQAAFVTIGDPFIYSTYMYLLKTMQKNFPEIEVETVPGISAFNAASARLNFGLVEGYQRLAVIAVSKDLNKAREALKDFDTVVLMKVGAKLDQVITLLKELRLLNNSVLISRAGLPDEKIVRNLAFIKDKKIGYLSVILVRKDKK